MNIILGQTRTVIIFLLLFFSFFIPKKLTGQTTNRAIQIINFEFICYDMTDSIPLPVGFKGPAYLPYENGSIITFVYEDTANFSDAFDDYCIVSILCGTNMKMNIDKSYVPLVLKESEKDASYYSKTKNKYARRTYLKNYLITYEQASIKMREALDKIIDSLKYREEE